MIVMSELEILSKLKTLGEYDVISICDDYKLNVLDTSAKRVLHLNFLDNEKDFNKQYAKQIVKFVKEPEKTIVHCKYGQSRSAAVGAVYNNNKTKNMNTYVYNILKKEYKRL